MRIGIGYDVHQLVENRKLILGGVEIPYHLGLLGHSDADVLTHAICDAILGAAALGDIGTHFPDTDDSYAGMDSQFFLQVIAAKVREENYSIENIDSTVIAQKPKLAPYILQMRQMLAKTLGISEAQVSVKATTAENLGIVGEGKAIVAQATVCLSRD
jgi:2-C-methyl-D-erythritol 2,4-cyclodiphosphate synthase